MVVSPQPSTGEYSPSERVVRVVADSADVDPLELPPLQHAMDGDTLDAVVGELDDGSLRFRYADRYVTVHGDGTVDVTERTAATAASPNAADD